MLLLDTNIISELMRQTPDRRVETWMSGQSQVLAISSITVAELSFGLAAMDAGRRRDELARRFDDILSLHLLTIIDFGEHEAKVYGAMLAEAKARGNPVEPPDVMIAATAKVQATTLVTRNTKDFSGFGLDLIDPFAFG